MNTKKKNIWSVKNTILNSEDVTGRLKELYDIKFVFPKDKPQEDVYSCFKIYMGRKFFIAKTKTCLWLPNHLNKMLKQYNISGLNVNDIYFPIVKHIHNTGYYECPIQFICQSDNPYEVIKAEFLALQENKDNTLCINRNDAPYVPKFNSKTGMFGWLTRNQFLNYARLLKKHSVDVPD